MVSEELSPLGLMTVTVGRDMAAAGCVVSLAVEKSRSEVEKSSLHFAALIKRGGLQVVGAPRPLRLSSNVKGRQQHLPVLRRTCARISGGAPSIKYSS